MITITSEKPCEQELFIIDILEEKCLKPELWMLKSNCELLIIMMALYLLLREKHRVTPLLQYALQAVLKFQIVKKFTNIVLVSNM